MPERIPFSGNPFDRATGLRRDEAWLESQLGAVESRYLAFWRMNPLAHGSDQMELHWLDASVREHLSFDAETFFLGIRDGVAHFAVDLSTLPDPIGRLGIEDADFHDARRIAPNLREGEAGIVAQARALLEWDTRHRYCGTCGSPTALGSGGAVRKCTSCGAEHFPGPHPVVIMVVYNGDRCLLGRGRGWAPGRYSALAGFVDLGETLEEAVAREVKEEVGLTVDEVQYHTSQPWPFPMSLMLGCFAHVSDTEINVDPEELDEARWFTRDEILRAYEDPTSVDFGIPGKIAIAHHLIRDWGNWSA